MYCPNPDCPDVQETGEPGEYRDDVRVCPKCGAELISGAPGDDRDGAGTGAEGDAESTGALVAVAAFNYRQDAELAASFLQANGVEAAVFGDDCGGTDPRIGFSSRARVMVPEGQAALAATLLDQASAASAEGGEPCN